MEDFKTKKFTKEQNKLIFSPSSNKPEIKESDKGIWRRIWKVK